MSENQEWGSLPMTDWSNDHPDEFKPEPIPKHRIASTEPSAPAPQQSLWSQATTTPAETPAATTQAPTPTPIYRRRRSGFRMVAIIIGALLLLSYGSRLSSLASPSTSNASTATTVASAPPGSAPLVAEIAAATSYQSSHGTYLGWPTPSGAKVAALPDEIVIAQVIDGTCYYGGLTQGEPEKVLTDPTGKDCTTGAVAAAQQAMLVDQKAAVSIAEQALETAAQDVQLMAKESANGATPSFTTLPSLTLPNVIVLSVTATEMHLESQLSTGGCLSLTVPAEGPSSSLSEGSCQG